MKKLLVVLVLALAVPAGARCPLRFVWKGTITSAAGTGVFHARVHWYEDRANGWFKGTYRCRGPACPRPRRGRVDAYTGGLFSGVPCVIDLLSFGGCSTLEGPPLPDWAIDGAYACYPEQLTGTLKLEPVRRR